MVLEFLKRINENKQKNLQVFFNRVVEERFLKCADAINILKLTYIS